MKPLVGSVLLLALVGCKASARVGADDPPRSAAEAGLDASAAPVGDGSAGDASTGDASAGDERASAAPGQVPWIVYGASGASDELGAAPSHRVGGLPVRPRIELPAPGPDGRARSFEDVVNGEFPMIPFRAWGLPAISADGARVAYVFSPTACCRFARTDFELYVIDAHTGGVLKKLPLVRAEDELYIPQRDGTGAQGERGAPGVSRALTEEAFHVNAKRFEKRIASRAQAANAELAGDWLTLASIDPDAKGFRGEGATLPGDIDFKSFDVRRDDGRVTHVVTAGWRVTLPSCPPDRYTMSISRAWGLRDAFVLLEVGEDDGPDGCETSTLRLVRTD